MAAIGVGFVVQHQSKKRAAKAASLSATEQISAQAA
jgi:hypothetical protein